TENVWLPAASAVYAFGDEQDANEPASSLHSKVAPASLENEKLGFTSLDGSEGFAVSVTVGAVVSIVHVYAVEAPVLPAASVPRTENVWLPAARAVYAFGEVQLANEPASSLHSNVEGVSDDVNE